MLSPDNYNNQTHKQRFQYQQPASLSNGAPASQNTLAYVKGVDFNSQQKYDYNILNHESHSPGNPQGQVSRAFSPPPRAFNYGMPGFHK